MSGRVLALLLGLGLALLGGCGKYGRPIRAVVPESSVTSGAAAPAHAEDCEDPDHDHSRGDAEAEPPGAGEPEASP